MWKTTPHTCMCPSVLCLLFANYRIPHVQQGDVDAYTNLKVRFVCGQWRFIMMIHDMNSCSTSTGLYVDIVIASFFFFQSSSLT